MGQKNHKDKYDQSVISLSYLVKIIFDTFENAIKADLAGQAWSQLEEINIFTVARPHTPTSHTIPSFLPCAAYLFLYCAQIKFQDNQVLLWINKSAHFLTTCDVGN
jgi:hypothetical protein